EPQRRTCSERFGGTIRRGRGCPDRSWLGYRRDGQDAHTAVVEANEMGPEVGASASGGPGAGIDVESANAARMYDYLLGGAQNFKVDRDRVEAVCAANPQAVANAWANRAFLGRVVSWCTARGIDQFLDLGSGVPTVGNVHEVAHQALPDARVAYVDFEPVAVA